MNAPTPSPGPLPPPDDGMVWIPGGAFQMGDDRHYPEERPAHRAAVAGFWMDAHLVTNDAFARFVAATGYVTLAERTPEAADYPGADPALVVAGSLVFQNPGGPVPLADVRRWWAYVPGASWRAPEGPGSSLDGRGTHPVVHVAVEDAEAYAVWAGKALPAEAEWEFAARSGLDGAPFAWGDALAPEGRHLANTWQGAFPWQNLAEDGYAGTSPVGAYPANAYGVFDLIGNVWEWTADAFHGRHAPAKACCTPGHGRGAAQRRRVVKGGSHLCAPGYCQRYRPAARQGEAEDTSTSHVGFRCVRRTLPGAR